MNENIIPGIIIPKYNCVNKTLESIDGLMRFSATAFHSNHKPIVSLEMSLEKKDIEKLSKIKEFVDIIKLDTIDETVLDNEYGALSSKNLDMDGKFVIYSPDAKEHNGKMSNSNKSDASYIWLVERQGFEDEPAALLVQLIKEHGKTSRHYHLKTNEFFLSIAGTVFLEYGNIGNVLKSEMLSKKDFFEVNPNTIHQLKTKNMPALNLLCMSPYDPDLKDHHYI